MPVHHKDPCPCGSGKRYKHCCLPREAARRQRTLTFAGLGFLAVVTGAGLVLARRGDQARDTAPASGPLSGGTGGSPFGTLTPGTNAPPGTVAGAGAGSQVATPTSPAGSQPLAPGESPKPWHYDVAGNRHFDPRPEHNHWHTGPPPPAGQRTSSPVTTQTTQSTGGVSVAANEPLKPGENPAPWFYDQANNRHYDPRPEHRHWHPGAPPANPGALGSSPTTTTITPTPVPPAGTPPTTPR
jgi:hypothetical protein